MPDLCLTRLGLAGEGPLTMAALSPGRLPCGWRWAGCRRPHGENMGKRTPLQWRVEVPAGAGRWVWTEPELALDCPTGQVSRTH